MIEHCAVEGGEEVSGRSKGDACRLQSGRLDSLSVPSGTHSAHQRRHGQVFEALRCRTKRPRAIRMTGIGKISRRIRGESTAPFDSRQSPSSNCREDVDLIESPFSRTNGWNIKLMKKHRYCFICLWGCNVPFSEPGSEACDRTPSDSFIYASHTQPVRPLTVAHSRRADFLTVVRVYNIPVKY